MQTIVDLPQDYVTALDRLGQAQGISRAELVRRAIAMYLAQQAEPAVADAFGLWGDAAENGLSYQERLRGEWADREHDR